LKINGHAIEARIYAENPEKGFLPSIGKLRYLRTPQSVEFSLGHGTEPAAFRIDSGVREGDTISPFYDPMIAKMIVWGKDRTEALARMRQALAQYRIVGLHTNIAFLSRLMHSDPFSQADLDTGLIERHHDSLFPAVVPPSASVLALAVAGLLLSEQQAGSDPWQSSHGWRMNLPLIRELRFSEEEQQIALSLQYSAGSYQCRSPVSVTRCKFVSLQAIRFS
jgi:3-methylcrotonyl-CoA carboxylase alpha subunit